MPATAAAAPSLLDQAISRVRSAGGPEFRGFIAANSGMLAAAAEMQSDEELAGELLQALPAASALTAEAAPATAEAQAEG